MYTVQYYVYCTILCILYNIMYTVQYYDIPMYHYDEWYEQGLTNQRTNKQTADIMNPQIHKQIDTHK